MLCTTSTLALGVNLPARLVVVKGTRRYVGSEAEDASGYQEYERSTCLQVGAGCGSAGHAGVHGSSRGWVVYAR